MIKKITLIAIVGVSVLNFSYASEWDKFVDQNVRIYSKKRNSGYIVRGGFGPAESIGPPKKIEWFKVDGNLDTSSNNCGGLDFGAQFKALFNKDALNQYLGEMKSLVSQVVAAAPMLLLQSVDPQMAEILKHLKAMANINMSTKMGQCRDLYKAMSNVGRQMFQPGKKNCVEKQLSAQVDIEAAMRNCNDHKELPPILGQPVGLNQPIDISQRISEKFGLDENQTSILKGIMGDTTLNASGIVQYKDFIRDRKRERRAELTNEYKEALRKGLSYLKRSSDIPMDLMKKMSSSTIPMSKEMLTKLTYIKDRDHQNYLINTLSQTMANEKLGDDSEEDIEKVKKAMSAASKDAGLKEAVEADVLTMPGADNLVEEESDKVDSREEKKLAKSDRSRNDVKQVYKEIEVSFNKQVELQDMYNKYNQEMIDNRRNIYGSPFSYRSRHERNIKIYDQMRGFGHFGGY